MKILMPLIFILLISCGKHDVSELVTANQKTFATTEVAEEESYKYSFDEGSCETGEQVKATFAGICVRLKDHSQNNNCAEEKREQLFISSECPGNFS